VDCNPDNSEVCSFPFALKQNRNIEKSVISFLIHKLSLSLEKLVNLQNEKYFLILGMSGCT